MSMVGKPRVHRPDRNCFAAHVCKVPFKKKSQTLKEAYEKFQNPWTISNIIVATIFACRLPNSSGKCLPLIELMVFPQSSKELTRKIKEFIMFTWQLFCNLTGKCTTYLRLIFSLPNYYLLLFSLV